LICSVGQPLSFWLKSLTKKGTDIRALHFGSDVHSKNIRAHLALRDLSVTIGRDFCKIRHLLIYYIKTDIRFAVNHFKYFSFPLAFFYLKTVKRMTGTCSRE